jgi:RNA polymerase sigma-70 factor, ECF subfamily
MELREPAKLDADASDDALVSRIACGDRRAMQVLYARHSTRVFRFVQRLVHDQANAEEVMSDVFFDVWQQAGRFQARSSVTTWLLSIARFKALSSFRKKRHEPLDPDAAEAIEDEADNPEVIMQKATKANALQSCLAVLSAAHREVIDLVYYHERSVEEVSVILGIPENTVKTRMFHARKRLSEMLKLAGIERGWP